MSENPYAPPSADLDVPVSGDQSELAGRGSRLLASIIDTLIMLAIQLPLMFAMGFFTAISEGREPDMATMMVATLIGLVAFVAINGWFLAKRGQSLGKMAMKVQIVSVKDGQLLSLGRLVGLRFLPVWLVSMIPALGSILPLIDVLFIFRKDRRCVHDLIAGTQVIEYRAAA